jgi:hypothetical protein
MSFGYGFSERGRNPVSGREVTLRVAKLPPKRVGFERKASGGIAVVQAVPSVAANKVKSTPNRSSERINRALGLGGLPTYVTLYVANCKTSRVRWLSESRSSSRMVK